MYFSILLKVKAKKQSHFGKMGSESGLYSIRFGRTWPATGNISLFLPLKHIIHEQTKSIGTDSFCDKGSHHCRPENPGDI